MPTTRALNEARERPHRKPGPVKGKKSVPWEQDPEILVVVERVSQMLLAGARIWQIAAAIQSSMPTAVEYAKRARKLWRDEARDQVKANRDRAVAQLRLLQTKVWAEVNKEDQLDIEKVRMIRQCEVDIAKLQGTEEPVSVRVRNISDAELKAEVAEILAREQDNGSDSV